MEPLKPGMCHWILHSDFSKPETMHCRKPTKYKMVWDGGEVNSRKVRQYDPFCKEHVGVTIESRKPSVLPTKGKPGFFPERFEVDEKSNRLTIWPTEDGFDNYTVDENMWDWRYEDDV